VDSEVIPYHGRHRMLVVDGLATSYLEAGDGPPLILLHSGEFGACAELSWEFNIEALSGHFRVIAPDWLGYGQSAKVHDFTLGTGLLIRHLRRFCEVAGITTAPFVGNSIAAGMLLSDAASDQPELPASAIVAIAGGGDVAVNEHVDALFAYDCSVEAMQRLLKALFHSPKWFDDSDYLKRRHELSLIPGSWECVAAARFRSPAAAPAGKPGPRGDSPYAGVSVPTLVIEGGDDKLKPAGWSKAVVQQIEQATRAVVTDAGHCPQIEQPATVNDLIMAFLVP
jgi:2-hydroxymuconate-semialdehyde hydrolase